MKWFSTECTLHRSLIRATPSKRKETKSLISKIIEILVSNRGLKGSHRRAVTITKEEEEQEG